MLFQHSLNEPMGGRIQPKISSKCRDHIVSSALLRMCTSSVRLLNLLKGAGDVRTSRADDHILAANPDGLYRDSRAQSAFGPHLEPFRLHGACD
jgi:hypothetical protein